MSPCPTLTNGKPIRERFGLSAQFFVINSMEFNPSIWEISSQFIVCPVGKDQKSSISKCASVGFPARPLIGRMSCGHAENATTRSISARSRI